ncbi:hypothetical protein GCM10023340_00750 [Nocardioides marinquilinus]|uniref:DUF3566 domain-containing protein n=1 Tax=Nocardioides marinquilinus TaxID=1210400 RepID=A0ABP9P438_9ACTN
MSDRPAPPTSPPAARQTGATTTPRTPPPAKPPTSQQRRPVLPPPPAEAPATTETPVTKAKKSATSTPEEPAASTSTQDTAVRGSLAERIQAKLASRSSSTDEADATTTAVRPTLEKDETSGRHDKQPKPARVPKSKTKAKPTGRGPRKARLRLTRVDPWSVMKTAFLLSIAFGIVTVVTVAIIMQVLNEAGVWTSINDSVREVIEGPETGTFDIRDYVGTERVVGFAMLVAAVDVILLTAVATLGAFLYNMSAALLGGIEVTLAEDN